MMPIRRIQGPTVLLTLVFSLAALGVLPTAVCCQAMTASTHAEECPHMAGADGEACPMHQPTPDGEGDDHQRLLSCSTQDPLLAGLGILTGAMPETASPAVVPLNTQPLAPEPAVLNAPIDLQPHAPPPRS